MELRCGCPMPSLERHREFGMRVEGKTRSRLLWEWVMADPELPRSAKHLALIVGTFADPASAEDRYPDVEMFGFIMRASERTVRRAVKSLLAAGYPNPLVRPCWRDCLAGVDFGA